MYLENINGPSDVKKLTIEEMNKLAAEMRDALLKKSKHTRRTFRTEFWYG